MSFDLDALRNALARHGRVVRVVVAKVQGSTPRGVGAAMLIWQDGQSGTIGGGTLEFEAARAARELLRIGGARLSHHALGPDMGQCCGGTVSLLSESYDAETLPQATDGVIARMAGASGAARACDHPLGVRRILARTRAQGTPPDPALSDGWMIEPVQAARRPLWIWGAGHVGRALVGVFDPLPEFAITWVDTDPARFPETVPARVETIAQPDPARLCPHVPPGASHLVLTYSHDIDLALCDGLLRRDFATLGLIGSATKWTRFRKRLGTLGHAPAQIARITCPIGAPALGKHPQQIAIGTAAALLDLHAAPCIAERTRA